MISKPIDEYIAMKTQNVVRQPTRADQPDFGALGPVSKGRCAVLETIASDTPQIRGRESLNRLKYLDSSVIERMVEFQQVSRRQFDAFLVFESLFHDANLSPSVVAGYGATRGAGGLTAGSDEPTPRDRYRALGRKLGTLEWSLLEGLALDVFPGISNLPRLRVTLDALAKYFNI